MQRFIIGTTMAPTMIKGPIEGPKGVKEEHVSKDGKRLSGKYKMIGIWGKGKGDEIGSGHCMAARLHKNNSTISFFDPNFGEFTFTDLEDFKSWLPKFWKASGYSKFIGKMSHKYEVHSYNK